MSDTATSDPGAMDQIYFMLFLIQAILMLALSSVMFAAQKMCTMLFTPATVAWRTVRATFRQVTFVLKEARERKIPDRWWKVQFDD